MLQLKTEYLPAAGLKPYANNARTHSDEQVVQIANSINEFGFNNPILIDPDGGVIAGHGRLLAALSLEIDLVPTISLPHLSDAQRRAYVIADNQIAANAGWNVELLNIELAKLADDGIDIAILGFAGDQLIALSGDDIKPDQAPPMEPVKLADKFLIPPFTVMNAREGWWQDRKRQWLGMGIKSEVGRGENLLKMSDTMLDPDGSKGINKAKAYNRGEWLKERPETGFPGEYVEATGSGTSIFDPVLCELAYRWFSPPRGVILDPFAGGSVRGIVASKLGRGYVGHELRGEQVEANRDQAEKICTDDPYTPRWIEGDSRTIPETCADVDADFIFSCPPYADLEVYSDDPLDLSTLKYEEFRQAYFDIIAKACARLKQDRFACFVVGEVRDNRGAYYDFVGDTVQAFRDAGLDYYNEAILVTSVGSLALRAGRQFSVSRKLGKAHQNILVFVKGNPKKAVEACGEVEVADAFGNESGESEELVLNDTVMKKVVVSSAMANLLFAGCTPDYITNVCKASCCQSSSSPTGTMITIHPREEPAIIARGAVIKNGLLQPRPGEKRCPFKQSDNLCGIHFTPDKPFGCIASPFTLNSNGTLIVRNRYKSLKCYKEGQMLPAYVAFRASLDLIFGINEAARICAHLDAGGGNVEAWMPLETYEVLQTNDSIKHEAIHAS
jgi:hypothetical protein